MPFSFHPKNQIYFREKIMPFKTDNDVRRHKMKIIHYEFGKNEFKDNSILYLIEIVCQVLNKYNGIVRKNMNFSAMNSLRFTRIG